MEVPGKVISAASGQPLTINLTPSPQEFDGDMSQLVREFTGQGVTVSQGSEGKFHIYKT